MGSALFWFAVAVVFFWMTTKPGPGAPPHVLFRAIAAAAACTAVLRVAQTYQLGSYELLWLGLVAFAACIIAACAVGFIDDRLHRQPAEELKRQLDPL